MVTRYNGQQLQLMVVHLLQSPGEMCSRNPDPAVQPSCALFGRLDPALTTVKAQAAGHAAFGPGLVQREISSILWESVN